MLMTDWVGLVGDTKDGIRPIPMGDSWLAADVRTCRLRVVFQSTRSDIDKCIWARLDKKSTAKRAHHMSNQVSRDLGSIYVCSM